jgi:hypothetical protein
MILVLVGSLIELQRQSKQGQASRIEKSKDWTTPAAYPTSNVVRCEETVEANIRDV